MSLSKILYPLLSTGPTQNDLSGHDWKIVDWSKESKRTNKTKLPVCLQKINNGQLPLDKLKINPGNYYKLPNSGFWSDLPQNPECRNNPETFHSYTRQKKKRRITISKLLRVKWELQNFICYLCFATISATHYIHCIIELSQPKPVYCLSFFSKFFTCTFILLRFTHEITTEITSLISNLLENILKL